MIVNNNKKGFTLTELIVVISVTGILFTILAVLLSRFVITNRKLNIKNKVANEVYEIDLIIENEINNLNIDGLQIYINDEEKQIFTFDLITGEKIVCISFVNGENTIIHFGESNKKLQYIDDIVFTIKDHLLLTKIYYEDQIYERTYYLLKVGEIA